MKKEGLVGLIIILIWVIILYISIGKIFTTGDVESLTSMLPLTYPIITMALGYYLLNNMEHFPVAVIFFIVAVAITIIMLIFNIIKEPSEDFVKIYNMSTYINIFIVVILSPFLVRTQSKIHRTFKYINVLLLAVTFIMIYTISNNSKTTATLADVKALLTMVKVTVYIGIAALGLTAANPIIGYATSDGLGGSSKSKNSPKLVPVNPATDPTMASPSTINTGINYGDNPVPEGVVASPEPTIETQPVAPAQEAPKQTEEKTAQESPALTMNADEVAPELQFLINNKEE